MTLPSTIQLGQDIDDLERSGKSVSYVRSDHAD